MFAGTNIDASQRLRSNRAAVRKKIKFCEWRSRVLVNAQYLSLRFNGTRGRSSGSATCCAGSGLVVNSSAGRTSNTTSAQDRNEAHPVQGSMLHGGSLNARNLACGVRGFHEGCQNLHLRGNPHTTSPIPSAGGRGGAAAAGHRPPQIGTGRARAFSRPNYGDVSSGLPGWYAQHPLLSEQFVRMSQA